MRGWGLQAPTPEAMEDTLSMWCLSLLKSPKHLCSLCDSKYRRETCAHRDPHSDVHGSFSHNCPTLGSNQDVLPDEWTDNWSLQTRVLFGINRNELSSHDWA